MITPIRWERHRLLLLDQTLLPVEERTREYTRWGDVADAIRTLVVRGAPAIGCAAAFASQIQHQRGLHVLGIVCQKYHHTHCSL